jgi:oligoendopeptidase F
MDWDLSPYFPSFDADARVAFERDLERDLDNTLTAAKSLGGLQASSAEPWERCVLSYEELGARHGHFSSYVHALVSADGNNPAYQDAEARLANLGAAFKKLEAYLIQALGSADEATFGEWLARQKLKSAAYQLGRLRIAARRSMPSELEELAADLGTDGIDAWGRLYSALMSSLQLRLEVEGQEPKIIPFSARRSLMEGEDRAVRRAAFSAGNQALEPWLPSLGRALNHIAGTRLTLNKRRGGIHFLDVTTFESGISRPTLEAMFEAVERQIDVPRRVLRLKARRQGSDRIGWYDIGSMLHVANGGQVTWSDAVAKVHSAFGRRYPALQQFFDAAIATRWVDHSSRPGKRPGAFCTSSQVIGQSRVFMTFGGTLGDVSTLAHEMGHAFHAHLLRQTRTLASEPPMTLAESASIFAELLLVNGLLADSSLSAEQETALLAALVNDAPVFLLDVNSRFQFERAFYEERARGEVRWERLCELMKATQLQVFGDTLDPSAADPYFWASKLHFFITGVSFYNYPYIFGYLLSRGLYARFAEEGPGFLPKYEYFLERSGSEEPAALARSVLGCDLEQPEFWEQSIKSVLGPLTALEQRLSNC